MLVLFMAGNELGWASFFAHPGLQVKKKVVNLTTFIRYILFKSSLIYAAILNDIGMIKFLQFTYFTTFLFFPFQVEYSIFGIL